MQSDASLHDHGRVAWTPIEDLHDRLFDDDNYDSVHEVPVCRLISPPCAAQTTEMCTRRMSLMGQRTLNPQLARACSVTGTLVCI